MDTVLLLIIIAALTGVSFSDFIFGMGIWILIITVFVGVIIIFMVFPKLIPYVIGLLVLLILRWLIVYYFKHYYKKPIDKIVEKLRRKQKLNKNDLKVLLKDYKKSINTFTKNSDKGIYDMYHFTSEFTKKFDLSKRIYNLMFDLEDKLIKFQDKHHIDYRNDYNKDYGIWQSKVIPVTAIKVRIVSFKNANRNEVQLKYRNIIIILHPQQNGDEKTIELEVLENKFRVYYIIVQKSYPNTDRYEWNGDYSPEVFKPGEWLMEVHNLIADYNNEEDLIKKNILHNNLLLKKNDFDPLG